VLEDITRAEYLAEREKVKRALATLDGRATGADTRLAGLAGLLADVAAGWNAATPEQRNRLARLLFEEIVIDDNRIVAVKPRPELAGFFLLDCQTANKGARHVAREQRRRGLGQQIVALRDAGKMWAEVAAAVGLSHSRVRELHSRATGDREAEARVEDEAVLCNVRAFLLESRLESRAVQPRRRAYGAWPERVVSPATVENHFGSWARALSRAVSSFRKG
jgi:hypothetical protein